MAKKSKNTTLITDFGKFAVHSKKQPITEPTKLFTDEQIALFAQIERAGGASEPTIKNNVDVLGDELTKYFKYNPTPPKIRSAKTISHTINALATQLVDKQVEEEEDEDDHVEGIDRPTFPHSYDEDDEDVQADETCVSRVARIVDPSKIGKISELMTGQDEGLVYACYMTLYLISQEAKSEYFISGDGTKYDAKTISEFLDFEDFMRCFRSRRDIQDSVRQLTENYLRKNPHLDLSSSEYTEAARLHHLICAQDVLRFTKDLISEGLFHEFWRTIEYDAVDMKNGASVDFIQPDPSIQFYANHVQWVDAGTLKKAAHANSISGADGERRYRNLVQKLAHEDTHFKKRLTITDEAIFTDLKTKFPNFSEVIDFYKSQFRLSQLSMKEQIAPVLLMGDPGIGKTHFAKALAKALNTGYSFIDMASVSGSFVLSGLDIGWSSGKPGKLFYAMLESPTASPVVLFDEIEKTPTGGYKDPTTPLYQCLEPANAREFTDEFLDFPVDLSRIIYIACANSLNGLSEPLQSRFRVFHVPTPIGEHHSQIMQSVYSEETSSTGLFAPGLTDDALMALAPLSIREAKIKIVEAVGKALLELSYEDMMRRKIEGDLLNLELRHFHAATKKSSSMGFH